MSVNPLKFGWVELQLISSDGTWRLMTKRDISNDKLSMVIKINNPKRNIFLN